MRKPVTICDYPTVEVTPRRNAHGVLMFHVELVTVNRRFELETVPFGETKWIREITEEFIALKVIIRSNK